MTGEEEGSRYDITSPSIIYMYMYNCIYLSFLSPSPSPSPPPPPPPPPPSPSSPSPSPSPSLSFARLNARLVHVCVHVYYLNNIFFLSVISLHTCVFSRVKARLLNKPDAGKVYAVVGSTFIEFCFGVKSGS